MKHIKFAGLFMHWTREYAESFAKYLYEIGYLAKVMNFGSEIVVAYSYKGFSSADATEALSALFDSKGEGETK